MIEHERKCVCVYFTLFEKRYRISITYSLMDCLLQLLIRKSSTGYLGFAFQNPSEPLLNTEKKKNTVQASGGINTSRKRTLILCVKTYETGFLPNLLDEK